MQHKFVCLSLFKYYLTVQGTEHLFLSKFPEISRPQYLDESSYNKSLGTTWMMKSLATTEL